MSKQTETWTDAVHGVTRLEAFSDAVFAFSATLLVVSLEVPRTFSELVADLYGFVAFGFSFGALVLIWAAHNSYFRRFGLQDNITILLNAILLFVILFFVCPLKFLSQGFVRWVLGFRQPGGTTSVILAGFGELASLFILYGLGFVTIFACFAFLYLHARKRLNLSRREDFDAQTAVQYYLIYVFVGLVSVGIAWSGVGIEFGLPGWMYGALGPLCFWHGLLRDRQRPQV